MKTYVLVELVVSLSDFLTLSNHYDIGSKEIIIICLYHINIIAIRGLLRLHKLGQTPWQ